ncbi:MAG: HAD-IIB family hydrolase [Treponema sp.]|nr:HAD-IIB family hydrolase [Treponema sp.]
MKPVSEMTPAQAAGVKYVLTDIDDTLTCAGKLVESAYRALWDLRRAGLKLVPVTGRPAGWCDCIARQWPVDGIVGENGALAFWEEPSDEGLPILKTMFHENALRNDSPALLQARDAALDGVPGLRLAKDQFARLFDIALDFAEEDPALSLTCARRAAEIAEREGARAKISSIHVNIWLGDYDKLSMALRFLRLRFGWQDDLGEALFVGDSPNDEPMFAHFPLSCAPANIRRWDGVLQKRPAFIAKNEGGEGFAEIARALLDRADKR